MQARPSDEVRPNEFERRISFEGCFNFRDLGGYGTVHGRHVRTQRPYRADGPHALSAADVGKLHGLRLATVVDLRTPQEVSERGCLSDDTVNTRVVLSWETLLGPPPEWRTRAACRDAAR